jgi:peptide deformylase
MILPIVAYGNPILRKVAHDIDENYPDLAKFIEDMWETMYASNGVGLAAPQVNKDVRIFVMDSAQIFANMDEKDKEEENYPDAPGIKQVFINPHVVEELGDDWAYNEGCLSIPKIREDIYRAEEVTIQFQDANFKHHTKTFNGITARIILHEYDHIEGKLFIDKISPL